MAHSRPTISPLDVATHFEARFETTPRVFRAPGRINIIGELTDYCAGLAMPGAIDRHCTIAAAPNSESALRIHSLNVNQSTERPIQDLKRTGHWSDYVAGIAAFLASEGVVVPGFDLLISSDVPIGSGVSSSAALSVATTLALSELLRLDYEPEDIRRVALTAENEFCGVPCGPLDQFASVFGRQGHALLLDCGQLSAELVTVPKNLSFLLLDSGVKHSLSDGGYRKRRQECEAAASALGVPTLSKADAERLEILPSILKRRTRHVLSESARVVSTKEALARKDLQRVGELIRQSHQSLRVDFEVTCPETDALAAIADATDGVFGARQVGGGFGGAVLALVERDHAESAGRQIAELYFMQSGISSEWFVCSLADGAAEIAP